MAMSAPLSVKKHYLKEYLKSLPECKEALAVKAAEKAARSNPSTQAKLLNGLQASSTQKLSMNVALLFDEEGLTWCPDKSVSSTRNCPLEKPNRV